MDLKLGCKARTFQPGIPHYSALRMGSSFVEVPKSYDWTTKLTPNLGVMLNNTWGCCAEAGYYHAIQCWSSVAKPQMVTEPDSCVEKLYETQGFNPNAPLVNGQNPTDNGTVLQALLSLLVNTGAPMADGTNQKLFSFAELDPANNDDLNRATYEGGLIYFGTNIPSYIMDKYSNPGSVWDVHPELDNTSVGGHCIISALYESDNTRGFISWGSDQYRMTPAFWKANVNECYALVSQEFIKATGITPLGFSESFWASQMRAISI